MSLEVAVCMESIAKWFVVFVSCIACRHVFTQGGTKWFRLNCSFLILCFACVCGSEPLSMSFHKESCRGHGECLWWQRWKSNHSPGDPCKNLWMSPVETPLHVVLLCVHMCACIHAVKCKHTSVIVTGGKIISGFWFRSLCVSLSVCDKARE